MGEIVWIDLETTGISRTEDRIIEICMIKTDADGNEIDKFYSLINPEGTKSRSEALDKHGIQDSELEDKPTFRSLAKEMVDFIGDADLGGYNLFYFDLPFIIEEFIRSGIVFDYRSKNIIDPYKAIIKYESRDLESVYRRLFGTELEGSHRAENDIRATMKVFEKQKEIYGLSEDLNEIDLDINPERSGMIDSDGKFVIEEIDGKKQVVFNFGKYKGKSFKTVYETDSRYIDWFINMGDFASESKMYAKKMINKISAETPMPDIF